MVELITFLTGSVLLFFALKMVLAKFFIDTLGKLFMNPVVLTGLVVSIALFYLVPDIVTPYYEIFIEYFVNGIKSMLFLVWDLVERMFSSIL